MKKLLIIIISLSFIITVMTQFVSAADYLYQNNCVLWVRTYRVPSLPSPLNSLEEKIKIINSNTAKIGNVAIIETSNSAGHVAYVQSISGEMITIEEANYPVAGVGSRTNTESKLSILGYFDPNPGSSGTSTANSASFGLSIDNINLGVGTNLGIGAYNIAGYNYFKLRDIAELFKSTIKHFGVMWDGVKKTITLTPGEVYATDGSELTQSSDWNEKEAIPSTAKIYTNGQQNNIKAYTIDGYNYYKLRDMANMLDFGVVWDTSTSTIKIDTSTGYLPDATMSIFKQIIIHPVPDNNNSCEIIGEKDGWIYYYTSYGASYNYTLKRIKTDGTGDMVVKDRAPKAVICSDWIFFSDRSDDIGDLYRINLDGSGEILFQEGKYGYYSKGDSSISCVISYNDMLLFLGYNRDGVLHIYKTPADIFDRKDLYAFGSSDIEFIRQLLADGKWVYMVTDDSLYRIDTDTNQCTEIARNEAHKGFESPFTIQNDIISVTNWYEGYIYSMPHDMTNRIKIAPFRSPYGRIIGENAGWIFYTDEKTYYKNGEQYTINNFYKIKNVGLENTLLFSFGWYTNAYVKDGYIYFSDGDSIFIAK